MQNVLVDLALEVEASTVLALRVARAFDESDHDEDAALFARLAVAIGKFWNNKRIVPVVGEAMECLGGAGYVEESNLPRLYREAPLNGIWEGSGNVICLDVLRALVKTPRSFECFLSELETSKGRCPHFDRHLDGLKESSMRLEPARARQFTQDAGLALQAALLLQHAPTEVSSLFTKSRLGGRWGHHIGTLPDTADWHPILERAAPRWRV